MASADQPVSNRSAPLKIIPKSTMLVQSSHARATTKFEPFVDQYPSENCGIASAAIRLDGALLMLSRRALLLLVAACVPLVTIAEDSDVTGWANFLSIRPGCRVYQQVCRHVRDRDP